MSVGRRPRHRFVYPFVGAALALGAPGGYLVLRLLAMRTAPSFGWLLAELRAHRLLYAYLTISTVLVLFSLGAILGRKEDALAHISITDPLTGLFNRRYFESRLHDEVRRCQRYQLPLSIVLFDVDRFKAINDTDGHRAGDELLRAIGRVLSERCRAPDFIGVRQGGDEFAILLPHTSAVAAAQFADRVRREIRESTGATVSAGVAEWQHRRFRSAGDLFEAADRALYDAKAAGRDRVAS